MVLKGFTKCGIEVLFTLADCPILVGEGLIALVGKISSALIRYDTIVRGDEESGLYEGDVIYDEMETILGIVVYAKGFVLYNAGVLCDIPAEDNIRVTKGCPETIEKIANLEERTEISFAYKGIQYRFLSLICKVGDYVGLTIDGKLVNPEELLLNTGFCRKDRMKGIYFGEVYQGGTVVLHKNVPMIAYEGGKYVPLLSDN